MNDLISAVMGGEFEVKRVKELIKSDPKLISSRDSIGTPLHYAAYYCNKGAMELLLNNGADANAKASNWMGDNVTPLRLAEREGHKAIAELLRKHGGHDSDIHVAARNNDLVSIKALLKGEPSLIFYKDKGGFTPLHTAAANGQKEVAELLLTNTLKPDVNANNNHGQTPLSLATLLGHNEVVEFLLANGAVLNSLANSTVHKHSIEVDVCAATRGETTTEYKHPTRTTTTSYETVSLGKVTVTAKPGAGSQFTLDVQPDCRIAVRQCEYFILHSAHVDRPLPEEVRKALSRLVRVTAIAGCIILPIILGGVAFALIIQELLPFFYTVLGAAVISCATVFSIIWCAIWYPSVLLPVMSPTDKTNSKGAWLVKAGLFAKSDFTESLQRIWVVEAVTIGRPQKNYHFRYSQSIDDWAVHKTLISIPIHRSLDSCGVLPASLTSMFGQKVTTIGSNSQIWNIPK